MEPPPLLSVPVPSRFGRSRPTSRARSLHNVAAEVWSRTPPLLNLLILSSTLSTVIFLPIVNHIDILSTNTAPPTVLSAGRSPRPHDPVQPAHTHTHLQSQRRSEGPRTHTINDTLKSFEQPSAFPALSALVAHWPAALTQCLAYPPILPPPSRRRPQNPRINASVTLCKIWRQTRHPSPHRDNDRSAVARTPPVLDPSHRPPRLDRPAGPLSRPTSPPSFPAQRPSISRSNRSSRHSLTSPRPLLRPGHSPTAPSTPRPSPPSSPARPQRPPQLRDALLTPQRPTAGTELPPSSSPSSYTSLCASARPTFDAYTSSSRSPC